MVEEYADFLHQMTSQGAERILRITDVALAQEVPDSECFVVVVVDSEHLEVVGWLLEDREREVVVVVEEPIDPLVVGDHQLVDLVVVAAAVVVETLPFASVAGVVVVDATFVVAEVLVVVLLE